MISVVTITYNNFEELVSTVDSLKALSGRIEHIIVNGGSCQRTLDYLETFKGISVSEPDKGIADAFNKGLRLATGEAVLFLNSGDLQLLPEYLDWADLELKSVDFTYADILFDDQLAGVIRLRPHGQALGRGMPYPHQTLIVKRAAFDELGPFKLDYKRAMCFEFVCRMERAKLRGSYYPKSVVRMDGGGVSASDEASTLSESQRALRENDLWNLTNKIYFWKRSVLFKIRQTLVALGMAGFLAGLKRIIRR